MSDETDLLECVICFEPFMDPRLLSCAHTFCLTCIEPLVNSRTINCPICRQPTTLQSLLGGASKLTKNFHIEKIKAVLFEKERQIQKQGSKIGEINVRDQKQQLRLTTTVPKQKIQPSPRVAKQPAIKDVENSVFQLALILFLALGWVLFLKYYGNWEADVATSNTLGKVTLNENMDTDDVTSSTVHKVMPDGNLNTDEKPITESELSVFYSISYVVIYLYYILLYVIMTPFYAGYNMMLALFYVMSHVKTASLHAAYHIVNWMITLLFYFFAFGFALVNVLIINMFFKN